MKDIKAEKDKVREKISLLKKEYSLDDLLNKSNEVMSVLEIVGVFQDAKHILIYNNMSDEVATLDFIKKWEGEKKFYLPVTYKDKIVFREYNSSTVLEKSKYGISEPIGDDISNYSFVDLIIVPGVAFDRKMNRMGRGKGYYDKFLPQVKAPRVGVCFDFQLLDTIPADNQDVKMDYIVSENDLIW